MQAQRDQFTESDWLNEWLLRPGLAATELEKHISTDILSVLIFDKILEWTRKSLQRCRICGTRRFSAISRIYRYASPKGNANWHHDNIVAARLPRICVVALRDDAVITPSTAFATKKASERRTGISPPQSTASELETGGVDICQEARGDDEQLNQQLREVSGDSSSYLALRR